MTSAVIPEVKGVPSGLTAEPINGSAAAVKGVPVGLVAEPIVSANAQTVEPEKVQGVPANVTAHPIQPKLPPEQEIYQQTIAEGQTTERAQQRVHEYTYGIQQGLSPERAKQFANSLQFKDQPKKILSDAEKTAAVTAEAQNRNERLRQIREHPFAVSAKDAADPLGIFQGSSIGKDLKAITPWKTSEETGKDVADAYADARARGWTEQQAQEYARSGGIGRAFTRISDRAGTKIDTFTGWLGEKLGKPNLEERAANWHDWFKTDQGVRNKEFDIYSGKSTGSLVGKLTYAETGNAPLATLVSRKVQKQLGSGESKTAKIAQALDAHIAQTADSLFSPDNVALIVASEGRSAAGEVAEGLGLREAPVLAKKAARTISELAHVGFTAQMAEGTSQSLGSAWNAWSKKDEEGNRDVPEAIGYTLDALVNGMMTFGGVHEAVARAELKGDLNAESRRTFGTPKFGDLNDAQQAVVITKLVENSANWEKSADVADRDATRHAKRMNYLHGRALNEAWNPKAAARAIDDVHALREARGRRDSIVQAIETMKEQRNQERELALRNAIQVRPLKVRDASRERSEVGRIADSIADKRDSIWKERNAVQQDSTSGVPQREIEVVPDGKGGSAYPAFYWGEENNFGTAPGEMGHSVYRQTPRGVEWLGTNGNFTEDPESLYVSPDPETADTLARLQALDAHLASLSGGEGATPEGIREADEIAEIRRSLVNGEINAKEAQNRAGIADKVKLPDKYTAARDGNLNGPLHEQGPNDYYEGLRAEAEEAGLSEEDTEAVLNHYGMLARQQTEGNLHHVYRPGDYVVSKRGVKWTLDSKGMLHPDDGSQPVPLMKRGLYSNVAVQLAQSGRVGYGTITREERRAADARKREALADIRDHQEAVDREMRLAAQREGLTPAAEAEPRADTDEKAQREGRFMSRPPKRPESSVGQIVRMVLRAPSDASSIIKAIANRSGVTPEEVMRLQLANDPERATTVEGKAARLEVGDTISDDFRKNLPWKVEEGKDGKMYLRSGNASPLPLDRLNPSERVKGIIEKGNITGQAPEFSAADVSRAAFEVPHYVKYQEDLADQVKERKESKVKAPEPRTQVQAKAQAQAAIRRAAASQSVATRAVIDALSPTTDSVEKAEAQVVDANEKIKVAEEAVSQAIHAEAQTIPKDAFPERAPATIGLRGKSGTISQNGREIPFHYELLPIEGLVTSHTWNGATMEVNEDYPSELQPRTVSQRESDENALRAQRRVVSESGRATGYNFREYADSTINGTMGPAIVDEGGRVVGGNTRIAIMRRHLQNLESTGDAETREVVQLAHKGAMRRLAEENGIPGYPDDGKDYVVVRMMDAPIKDTREAAELGRLFNKPVSVQITKSARGVSYSKSFTTPVLEDIGRRVEVNDGIIPAMESDPEFFREIVTRDFGVDPVEYADWFDEKPGRGLVLNDQGRSQFVKALLGTVIKDTSILNRLEGKAPYRALERALGYVVQMRALPDRDISGKIEEALQAASETIDTDPDLSASKDKWLATYHPDQAQLAGMETDIPPEPDRVVEALWRAMSGSESKSPRVLNDRLKAFIGEESSRAGQLFDAAAPTPAEAFNGAFSRELTEVQHSRGDRTKGVSQEEFEQALRNREMSDVEREEAEQGGSEQAPVEFTTTEAVEREKSPKALSWTDRSVRDFPVTATLVDGKVTVVSRMGRKMIGSITIDPAEWPKDTELGNPAYTRRQLVRKKMVEARLADFEDYGADQAERIADAMVGAAKSAFKSGQEPDKNGKMERPPKPPGKELIAETNLAVAKQEDGYVTPAKLKEFLENHPATKDSAAEMFRTARLMAEYVYESDPPIGVDKKDALDWVLKERLAGIEAGELKSKRGQYSDPNVEKNWGDRIMKLHKAADASTFIHEFAHVIFPMLSDEDLRAIDTIYGEKGKVWDGTKRLDSDAYKALSEKLAHGMERFLRDENPTGFSSEVKAVLAKIKEMMKKVYMAFAKDPLSKFENTEQSREVFSKMFGITDFDVQDDWQRELKKARAEEGRFKSPKETPHPLQKQATEAGATGLRDTLAGKVEDTTGDRVDPRKPTAVFVFANAESAASFWQRVATGATKLENAELIHAEDDTYGVRFNTKTKVSPDVMYQDLPQRHIGLQLEDARKLLESTPESFPSLRKLRQLKVQNLENEIRAKYGADELAPESAAEAARDVLQEVKSEKGANGVRKDADAVLGVQDARRAGGISKPPVFRVPVNAGAGQRGLAPRPERTPTSLSEVTPVRLEPLPKPRGVSVGTVVGETFDAKAWVEGLKRAGLPETLPAPTWALDRKTADKLIFPGQKQVVQTALSALDQGDGAVVATSTGTGKTYSAAAIMKEWLKAHPDAKILHITKNASLLKDAQRVAVNTFGFEIDGTVPDEDAPSGVYGTTYSRLIRSDAAKNTKWDLVIADESGEARNWFREENKQGKSLMDVTANSNKAVYFSATPFHSPMEYGYLNKLGLWPKNGFDRWIENNFAHEKVDDKIVAKLDPGKQAKLRQQLIERGQLVSQAISYDGFTAHFGVVPVTDAMKRGLDRIHEGFARAKKQLVDMKKKGVAEKAAALEATYTKAFLERERLPIAIEIAKKARANGWMVAIFSETSSEDLFRRPTDDPGTYQQLDTLMGGQLSQIIPPFENVYDRLREEFGSEIGDYSGMGNTNAERERAKGDFLAGETPMLYSTFAAGGIGVSLHDADFPERGIKGGDKPRIAIYLGPPYSGVLLEQAMGRFWRFGVKSDTHAVFLATDSEPDVRLMQQKVGPRMTALRASVLGERDSLASAMASYTDDEKVRARQDALAYQEGNEQRVDAASFQVRSKSRNVGINDWSQINFPPADTAKNKGMKYGEDVAGGDWSTLYQNREKAWMQQPESPNEAAGNYTVDAIGNGLAAGDGLPEGVSVQNLEPADRDVVIGASSAVAADAVEHPVERDKAATARQSMQSSLNLPGDKDKWILTFPKGKKGVWQYTGDPADIGRAEGPENEPKPKDIHAWYGGAMFTQEVGIRSIAKQAGNREAGETIVRMERSYQADADTNFASFALEAQNLMREGKLDEEDPKVMNDIWDAVEGKRVIDNPAIVRAAVQIADLHERVHGAEAAADVKLKTPAGETLSWKEFGKDRNYMPHRIDWEAQVQDPQTGEVHTLKEVMKETFAEASRRRIIETIAKERGYSYDRVIDYLKAYAPNTPVLGHIHRARTIDFPFIKKDWKTLMGYYRQAADAIAVEKNFGSDRKKLDAEIDRIKSVNGRKTISSMFDGLLEPQEWQDWTAKAYNAAIAYEAVTKMTISILKLPTHLIHVPMGLKGRVRPLAKAILHTALHPRETFENASYVGTLARQLNAADVIAKDDSQGITHQIFGKTGFNAAYKMVRVVSGESARIWMEQYAMHELKKGNAAEARRLLKDVMLIGDQGIDQALANGRFSPEDLGRGQTAFANMVAWTNNPLQMPGWARLHIERGESTTTVGLKRAVRLTYALQSFSLKSMSLLREHMWDEVMIHHNYKPLAYFMIAAPVAGQLLQATTAAGKGFIHRSLEGIRGKKHSEDSWDKYIAELEGTVRDPKPAKMLKFYLDSVTFGYGMDMLRTVSDPLMNFATGEFKKAGKEFEYEAVDLGYHLIGPAWGDLVKTIVLGTDVGKIESGQTHPAQKPKKVEAAAEKYVVGQVPILRQVPGMVPPPKRKTH